MNEKSKQTTMINLQKAECVYSLVSLCTTQPYIVCDAETFDDQIYVYFDKDGIVLDSSKRRVGSAPLIKGLTFTEWSIGKKLPSDDDKKFQTILTITQLVEKYDLEIDGIKFTAENEIVLQHGGITIELGEGEYLAVQMMNLGNILKNLEGMSGTLYMKDFDSENATASFSKN